jgi:hypothetical protein
MRKWGTEVLLADYRQLFTCELWWCNVNLRSATSSTLPKAQIRRLPFPWPESLVKSKIEVKRGLLSIHFKKIDASFYESRLERLRPDLEIFLSRW